MSESNFAMFGSAIQRDEQKVEQLPGFLLCFRRGRTFPNDQRSQDTAQRDHRKPPGFEFHKEDTPRLFGTERPELFYFLDLSCTCSVDAKLLRLPFKR